MAFFLGKVTRKMNKNNKEYFEGWLDVKIPVKCYWGKTKQDDIHVKLDIDKINYLDKKAAAPKDAAVVMEEKK
ncbi:MAG TPA: hypothetical protein DCL49_04500 [Candidatus Omnitrophica bacterium]|nr:hypothetical protein [Candidatus Omnitrophota bacterium]